MGKRKTYAELLRSPLWQKKRLEIFERDNYMCQYCGSTTKELHVHHKIYKKGAKPWEYDNDSLITLCHDCHESETNSKNELYQLFKDICSMNRQCGLSNQLLLSLLYRVYGEYEAITYGEIEDTDDMSLIHYALCGTQLINDCVILYEKGLFKSEKSIDDLKHFLPDVYTAIKKRYGNKDNK